MSTLLIILGVAVAAWSVLVLIVTTRAAGGPDATQVATLERDRKLARKVRWIPGLRSAALQIETFVAMSLGELDAMTKAARELSARGGGAVERLHFRNYVINAFVCAGGYEEALRLPPIPRPRSPWQQSKYDAAMGLIELNLAEAEYNLGRWDEAAARLERAKPAMELEPISKAGYHLQRCWILAARGEGAAAVEEWELIDVDDVPAAYQAENFYAHSAALLAAGNANDALAAVIVGESKAVRASSKRNALLLRARILEKLGRDADALRFFESAAAHPYKGQGGDGLLAWGDLLQRRGESDGARKAWGLVLERDPQSEAARDARVRIVRDVLR